MDSKRMPTFLDDVYQIEQFIDTFALGHYARVLGAVNRATGQPVAFKVLRPEHLSQDGDIRWEYRAFANEADLLMRLASSPHVINLLDCGFISAPDEAPARGELHAFERDVRAFTAALPDFATRGWRPYLALQYLPRTHNLLYLMKPNRPDVRWRLPSEEGLALAMQFGQMLKLAHSQRIAYLDHKLEHVYWDGAVLRVIDLNSSRLLAGPSDDHYLKMDVHNLCVGILYPLFTGLSPQKTALRPQPSGLADVEARYRDITTLDFGVEPSLSQALQGLLHKGAAMQIEDVDSFLDGLQQVAVLHGWDFPSANSPAATPNSRQARDQMRQGLRKLRQGQEAIREARDLFRDAAVQDGITPDLEDELRRLVRMANEMLNRRVVP